MKIMMPNVSTGTQLGALVVALMLAWCRPAAAQVPETMSYQGYLTNTDGDPLEGTFNLAFRLYDQIEGGTALWAESQTDIPVSGGVFSVRLGRTEPLDGVVFDRLLFLAVSVNGGAELEPRVALTSSPRSMSTRGLQLILDEGNTVSSLVHGGAGNEIGEGVTGSAIGGGRGNRITANDATLAGGQINTVSGVHATVGGGVENVASAVRATVGGGRSNTASGHHATVPGGSFNEARGSQAFAAGNGARAVHDQSFVWRGLVSSDSLVTTGVGQFLIGAPGGVGIGTNTPTSPLTVAGVVESMEGGFKFPDGTVQLTSASDSDGASAWQLGGNSGTSPDAHFIGTTDDAPLVLKANGRQVLFIEPGRDDDDAPNLIGGYETNRVERASSESPARQGVTISGGGGASVLNGISEANVASDDFATIGGGRGNRASGRSSTVGGGQFNEARTSYDVVAGGRDNTADGGGDFSGAAVGGGDGNSAVGEVSTVAGGAANNATGSYSAIPGGRNNEAAGSGSLAAGVQARASHDGTFVWASGSDDAFSSTAENQFLIRADGGVGIGSNAPQGALHITHPEDGTDLVLGGAGESLPFGDDGMISSDPDLPSSDLLLLSNDAVGVVLDVDGSDDEVAEFIITDNGLDEVFRVDLTGTVRSGSMTLDNELGEGTTLAEGGVYRDNVVYAWADVDADGTTSASFGCTVTKLASEGRYLITFDRQLTDGLAPVVTPESANPVMASVIPAGDNSEVTVYLFALDAVTGTFSRADNSFFIQVVGRP